LSGSQPAATEDAEQLVAVLHVRGETIGLAVDAAGRVYDGYRLPPSSEEPPDELARLDARAVGAADKRIWLIDPDRLWQRESPSPNPTA
jgi:chemotaxis signal transduction protein